MPCSGGPRRLPAPPRPQDSEEACAYLELRAALADDGCRYVAGATPDTRSAWVA